MPYARRRKAGELNKAYAHVTSKRFGEAARMLKDCLVDMGFQQDEAAAAVETPQGELPLLELRPTFRSVLAARLDLAEWTPDEWSAISLEESAPGRFVLTAQGPIG
jgi:type III restriction enzyme